MYETLNFESLIQALRERFNQAGNGDNGRPLLPPHTRSLFSRLLEVDESLPLDHLLDRLEQQWQRDGLL